MKTVGAYEAKTHLPRLLDEVAAGETITITKHGVPVAMLVPPPKTRSLDMDATIEAFRELRRHTKPIDSATIRAMIEEGRR